MTSIFKIIQAEYIDPVKPLILEYTTTTANESISLPLAGNVSINLVIWGDGTTGDTAGGGSAADNYSHTYVVPGTYVVSVKGRCSALSRCSDNVTKVISWGDVSMGLTSMTASFGLCSGLTSVPNDEYGAFKNVEEFTYAFSECTALTSLPSGLFDYCQNVKSFEYLADYSGLLSLPSGLFDKCINVTNFYASFFNCTGLTGSIPPGLFANCIMVTDFTSTFGYCSGLTGSIPTGLFANCTDVTLFGYTFGYCSGLTGSIPQGLFDKCTNVTSFYGTFNHCSGLTGSIPQGLFDNCPYVTDFNNTFSNCSGLTGSIPQGLFDNCTNVTNFNEAFNRCINLTGNTPTTNGLELWQRAGQPGYPSAINGQECFCRCKRLYNICSVPEEWRCPDDCVPPLRTIKVSFEFDTYTNAPSSMFINTTGNVIFKWMTTIDGVITEAIPLNGTNRWTIFPNSGDINNQYQDKWNGHVVEYEYGKDYFLTMELLQTWQCYQTICRGLNYSLADKQGKADIERTGTIVDLSNEQTYNDDITFAGTLVFTASPD